MVWRNATSELVSGLVIALAGLMIIIACAVGIILNATINKPVASIEDVEAFTNSTILLKIRNDGRPPIYVVQATVYYNDTEVPVDAVYFMSGFDGNKLDPHREGTLMIVVGGVPLVAGYNVTVKLIYNNGLISAESVATATVRES